MRQNGACYIRVSTDDQTEFSPDAQLKALKEYAKKNDIYLSDQHVYVDEGISGKRAETRPAFMKMIAAAKLKPKPFDIILVHKFDRFARSREDSVVYKSLLKKQADVKVLSITETIESDKFSVILEAMLEAMAEYYSLNLADEVKKGMTEKANRGEYQTCAPFGYVIANGKLEVVQEEAIFVKYIFEKYANQEMNMRQLACHMNDLGVKSKRGSPFENRTIDYILNNPVYIGKARWTPTGKARRNFSHPDSIVTDSDHEPLIDIELWNKAQDMILQTKELYGYRQRSTTIIKTWLTGLAVCGNCGKSLVVSQSSYLQCNGYSKGKCKASQLISIARMEALVSEAIRDSFPDERIELRIVPQEADKTAQDERELLRGQLEKLKVKESRIYEAYVNGADTLDEYKLNKIKLESDRQKAAGQLRRFDQSPIKNSDSVYRFLSYDSVFHLLNDADTDIGLKYKTAHFLIRRIVFNKQEQTLQVELKQ